MTQIPTTGGVGQKNVAVTGTAIQLDGGKCKKITIQAKVDVPGASISGNSDAILIGVGSAPVWGAAGTGFVLFPSQAITLEIDDMSQIYINGVAGDGIIYTYTY